MRMIMAVNFTMCSQLVYFLFLKIVSHLKKLERASPTTSTVVGYMIFRLETELQFANTCLVKSIGFELVQLHDQTCIAFRYMAEILFALPAGRGEYVPDFRKSFKPPSVINSDEI
jgi:hypothetical protein